METYHWYDGLQIQLSFIFSDYCYGTTNLREIKTFKLFVYSRFYSYTCMYISNTSSLFSNSSQRLRKKIARIENQRNNQHHPDYNIKIT